MKNILLIGGNGFLGSQLQRYYKDQDVHFYVVDKTRTDDLSDNSTFISQDINEMLDLLKGIKIDIVALLVHLKSRSEIDEVTDNLQFYDRICHILMKLNIKKIVYFSSGGRVYGNYKHKIVETDNLEPKCSYGITKLEVEKYIKYFCKTHKLSYLILRPSNPYGHGQRHEGGQGLIPIAIWNILNYGKFDIWGTGEEIRDYIYIDDFCYAVNLILTKGRWNEIYNIGSGTGHTTNFIIKEIRKIVKVDFKVNYKPEKKAPVQKNILDISKIEALGFKLSTGFQKGLKLSYDYINKIYLEK